MKCPPDSARPARSPAASCSGAATVEFALVATLALLPFVLGILQVGLLYVARHTLHHATFLGARAGAVAHGDRDAMLRHVARGLTPMYVRSPRDVDARNAPTIVPAAYAAALADVRRPDRTRLTVLNPVPASFADFERVRSGVAEIPNAFRYGAVGANSGQTLADANVLKIRVEHCAELVVPLVDRLLVALLRPFDPAPFSQACYADRRLPLVAYATVQMHSAPRRAALGW
jgi:hypothetical protein